MLTTDWYSNHALYALFPLISTDVLTPFIDLMEDALLQQVPPIVVSPITRICVSRPFPFPVPAQPKSNRRSSTHPPHPADFRAAHFSRSWLSTPPLDLPPPNVRPRVVRLHLHRIPVQSQLPSKR